MSSEVGVFRIGGLVDLVVGSEQLGLEVRKLIRGILGGNVIIHQLLHFYFYFYAREIMFIQQQI